MDGSYNAGSSRGYYNSYDKYPASHKQPKADKQKQKTNSVFMPQAQTSKQPKKDIDAELNYYETKFGYGKSNQDKTNNIVITLKDTSSAPVEPYKYGEQVDMSGIEFVGSIGNTNTNTTSQTQENNNECSFYQRAWIGSKAKEESNNTQNNSTKETSETTHDNNESSWFGDAWRGEKVKEESNNTQNNSTKETNETTYDNNESSWFGDAWRGEKVKEESNNTQNNSTKETNETTQEKPKEESSKKVDSYNVDSPNKTWIMPPVRERGRR